MYYFFEIVHLIPGEKNFSNKFSGGDSRKTAYTYQRNEYIAQCHK